MRSLKWIVLIAVAATTSVGVADDGSLARFEAACKQRGGRIEVNARKDLVCVGSTTSTSTAANPYTPLVEEFLKFWFMPGSTNNAEKQRRAAMMRELEAQREQARRNQQQAQAARLDAILQRLTSSDGLALKGVGGNNLRLKLGGPQRPLGMEVYQHPNDGKPRMGISGLSGINLDNETPTTTSARLTLKLGEDATRSLQAAPAPVAPVPGPATSNATDPAPAEARPAEVEELAKAISQLSPEEQQRLLAALRGDAAVTPGAPTSDAPKPPAAHGELSLKLSGSQAEADALKAAADSGASSESLKTQAEQQFQNLQQVSGKSVPSPSGNLSAPLDKAPPPNPAGAPQAARAPETDCGKPGTTDAAVVDLRCAPSPTVPVRPRPAAPPADSGVNTLLASSRPGSSIPLVESQYPQVTPAREVPGLKGLVGGTTWTYGFKWPQRSCDEKCRADLGRSLSKQLELYCASQPKPAECREAGLPFTPDLYDMVVSMGSAHSAIQDLATRVVFDGATYGEFSRQHKEIFASLKNRHFDTLDCHSNGAMLCLAALRSGDTTANEVRLFGPQMNPEAAKLWRELAGKMTVKIYINNGDPVPAFSWRQPLPDTAAGRATTSLWVTQPATLPASLAEAAFFTYVDSKTGVIDHLLRDYGLSVTRWHNDTLACSGKPSVGCHSMKLYETNLDRKD